MSASFPIKEFFRRTFLRDPKDEETALALTNKAGYSRYAYITDIP